MEFLQQLIPVSGGIWLICFILPAVLACLWQVWCPRGRRQWIPLGLAAGLVICVGLYRLTGFMAPVIGGFVALILLGTALFLTGGTLLGLLVRVWMHRGIF